MDESSRRSFASKLADLRDSLPSHYPPDQDPMGYESDLIEEKVSTFVDRLELLFESFGLAKPQGRLASMRKSFKGKDGYLWTIDDPPWRQGQYGAVAILEELVDNYLFAYSDAVGHDFRGSSDYQQLVQLLLGVERSLSVTQRYLANELEFQRMVDSILICRFAKLTHPNLPTAIKNFKPDTGVPEARTLIIEYKFISCPSPKPRPTRLARIRGLPAGSARLTTGERMARRYTARQSACFGDRARHRRM